MRILILNGSIHGSRGNCSVLIEKLRKTHGKIHWDLVHLAGNSFNKTLIKKIAAADAVLFFTGTYWDSWGSPLQKFFEDGTALEADPRIVGKPAGVCVLMHSVGGKEVLSRLQGNLSTLGFLIPPMSGMAYSLSGQLALTTKSQHSRDFWSLEDLDTIVANLVLAAQTHIAWQTWPVDRKNFRKKWIR